MDRNVVIATVLIAIIMFVWLFWLAPPPPEQSPGTTEDPITDTAAVVRQEAIAQEERAAEASTPATTADSTIAGAQQGEERLITVETDLYRAQFSSKGATLTSFVLKKYNKFDQETPVQLVDTSGGGALGLMFTTPSNHLVDTRDFFYEPSFQGETITVRGDEQEELTFRAQVGQGALSITYVFHGEEYEVGMRVAQENAASFSTREGYELVWDGGIPFTEGNPVNEAQSTGAFARSGGEVVEVTLNSDPYEEQILRGNVTWGAVKNKYFTAVMIPDEGEVVRGAELIGEKVGSEEAGTLWEDYTVRLLMPPSEGEVDAFRLYIGPMEFFRITDYGVGLYDMVDYGWDAFEWITRPLAKYIFIPAFTFLSTFIPNYGIVIIVFSILLKILLYPLTKSSYTSMARMRELQPKMEAIKEKHADNPQKQQEAMMKMYKETGVNPIGGCLPMLLQYPIIIALWQYLPQSIEIRQQGFLWAHDLSAPDVLLQLPFTIPVYGDFVGGFTLLMGLSMIVQMRLQMSSSMSGMQAKIFTYVFPVMIFAIFNQLAAGLSLYYLCYNIITALQQKIINRSIEKHKDDPAKTNGRGGRKEAKAVKGSNRRLGKLASARKK